MAAECADEQGAFWEYHDAIFEDPRSLNSVDDYVELAARFDLDTDEFRTCLEEERYREELINDFNDARAYGVTGTPTFFINGVRLVGAQPLAAFQAIIDEELANAD
ncbi:MAG TPA: hypothetical protein ENI95_06705 [Chloroflexi bacterium]|nr:hypothetical protein [Chloroflexota bacterium]